MKKIIIPILLAVLAGAVASAKVVGRHVYIHTSEDRQYYDPLTPAEIASIDFVAIANQLDTLWAEVDGRNVTLHWKAEPEAKVNITYYRPMDRKWEIKARGVDGDSWTDYNTSGGQGRYSVYPYLPDQDQDGYFRSCTVDVPIVDAQDFLQLANGVMASLSNYNKLGSYRHNDFGFPAIMLGSDSRAVDMVSDYSGYNWFSAPAGFTDCGPAYMTTYLAWYNCYGIIEDTNKLLLALDSSLAQQSEVKLAVAQLRALRAYAYFQLAQLYQFTYVGHEQSPCVPLVTEANQLTYAAEGAPRATVAEVYAQILADLNASLDFFKANAGGSKATLSLPAVYGLRARVNLVMNRWADAAEDARQAIASFDGQPLSLADASKPGFNSIDTANWIWGIDIKEDDTVVTTGLVNWPSHMGSFCYGYANEVGGWRMVNSKLYESIPSTDVRKGWFLDADSKSANLTEAFQQYADEKEMPAYTQVKFAPYQDQLNAYTNANDIPLMRVEEMYLTWAEAMAMSGDVSTAATLLTNFVRDYRDPQYSAQLTTAEQVQEACFQQRRVELWGEGLTTFDLMRLRKPFDRRGGGWSDFWNYNIQPDDPVLLLCIPHQEIIKNPQISEEQNNPTCPQPAAVF